jgi:hypothetical protein
MYTEWTRHIKDPTDKVEFEKDVYGSKRILDHLKGILKEKEKTLDRSELDPVSYDNPNWACKQAYKNGCRSSLHYMLTLIDLDQQNKE